MQSWPYRESAVIMQRTTTEDGPWTFTEVPIKVWLNG